MSPNRIACFQRICQDIFILILLFIFSAPSASSLLITDSIIATVDKEVITQYELVIRTINIERSIINQYHPEKDKKIPDAIKKKIEAELTKFRKAFVQQLIDEKVLWLYFKKQGFKIPEELIEREIDKEIQRQSQGDRAAFEYYLAKQGFRLTKLRQLIRQQLAVELLLSQEVYRKIHIAPKQIQAYYQNHIDQYTKPLQLRLQIIHISSKNRTPEEYKTRIDMLKEALANGTAFSKLADNYSEDGPIKKEENIEWISHKDLRLEFKNTLSTLEKGFISDPITLEDIPTVKDTYFIRIADIKASHVQALTEVYKQIEAKLTKEEQQKRYQKYLQPLRKKVLIQKMF